MLRRLGAGLLFLGFATAANAATTTTLTTQFNADEGFVTGDTGDVTLSDGGLSVTFSGGQQLNFFNPAAYNVGPAAYLFLNGTLPDIAGDPADPGPATGSSDIGLIDFSIGASSVSFFAANIGNGPFTELSIFAEDDTTVLGTINIFQTSNQLSDGAVATVIDSAAFAGNLIGSIGINLPGPAGNPPYALSIDSLSVTADVAAIPLPAPALLLLGGLAALGAARRYI
ncbi:MAG: hypothetical protein AAGE80_14820 [Pseudomonadota bacterium]